MEFFERRPILGSLLLFSIGCAISATLVATLVWLEILQWPPFGTSAESRGLEASSEKDLRVLVLGDSFVSHWNIEHHLKADLNAYAAQRDIGLINVGKYGDGPVQYFFAMRDLFAQLDPGLVLLFYNVGNDLTDVQYSPGTLVSACKPTPLKPPDGPKFDWNEMLEHGIDPELVEMARLVANQPNAGHERINPWMLRLAVRAPHYVSDNLLIENECNQAAWRHTEGLLSAMFETAHKAGADFHVVAIPESVQVDRSHFDLYRRLTFDVADVLLGSNRPQELLRRLCERHGVAMTDLLPRFEGHSDSASLYWPYDAHFSEAGHQFTFEIVREEILDPWVSQRRQR